MNQEEVHISSMVVHVRPDYLHSVKNKIEQLPGAEIHGESDNGKPVVVLESQTQTLITDVSNKINDLDYVLNTALVYHHIEQLDPREP